MQFKRLVNMQESVVAGLKTQIEEFITKRDHVTYAELSNHIPGFKRKVPEGELSYLIEDGRFDNLIFWVNVSDEAVAALDRLMRDGRIHRVPTSALVYFADGKALSIPIAKKVRSYKKPHWFPVCFRPGPYLSIKRKPDGHVDQEVGPAGRAPAR